MFLNEEAIRAKLRDQASEGAKFMKVTSLHDMIHEWVGSSIAATYDERLFAMNQIVQFCLTGFGGFDRIMDSMVAFKDVINPFKSFLTR